MTTAFLILLGLVVYVWLAMLAGALEVEYQKGLTKQAERDYNAYTRVPLLGCCKTDQIEESKRLWRNWIELSNNEAVRCDRACTLALFWPGMIVIGLFRIFRDWGAAVIRGARSLRS